MLLSRRTRAACASAVRLSLCVGALAACKPPPPQAPPAPASEPCPKVGQADPKQDMPKLRAMFLAHGRNLVVAEGVVYEIPCSDFKVEGASEQSAIAAHAEQSDVKAHAEASSTGAADEASKVAAANEASRADAAHEASLEAAANEASKVAKAHEESNLGDASSLVSCQRIGRGAYRLVTRADVTRLRVYDGATFFEVGADGLLR